MNRPSFNYFAPLAVILATFFFLSGCLPDKEKSAAAQRERLQKQVTAANELLHAGQTDRAIEQLEKLDKENPTNLVVLEALGFAYAKKPDPLLAAMYFEDAFELAPKQPELALFAAQAHSEVGQYEKASEAYRAYLKLTPEDTDAWRKLGAIEAQLQRNFPALNAYLEALRQSNEPPSTPEQLTLARLYHAVGNQPQAARWYESVLAAPNATKTERTDALLGQFDLALRQKSWDQAVNLMNELETLAPGTLADSVYSQAYEELSHWDATRKAKIAETEKASNKADSKDTANKDTADKNAADKNAEKGTEAVAAKDKQDELAAAAATPSQAASGVAPAETTATGAPAAETTATGAATAGITATGTPAAETTATGAATAQSADAKAIDTEASATKTSTAEQATAQTSTTATDAATAGGTTAGAGTATAPADTAKAAEITATAQPASPSQIAPADEPRATSSKLPPEDEPEAAAAIAAATTPTTSPAAETTTAGQTAAATTEQKTSPAVATPEDAPTELSIAQDASAAELATRGEVAFAEKNFELAAELLERSVKLNPGNAKVLDMLSRASYQIEKYAQAERYATLATYAEPKNLAYRLEFLRAYQRNNPAPLLLQQLISAKEDFPQEPAVTLALARGYEYIAKKKSLAANIYREYLELDPKSPLAEEIRQKLLEWEM